MNVLKLKHLKKKEQKNAQLDKSFITKGYLDDQLDNKVEKVNNKTGKNITLNASDIKATNTQTIQQNLERIDERIDDLDTEQIAVKNPATESLGGSANTQNVANAELVSAIKLLKLRPDVVDIVAVYDRGTDTSKTDVVHYDTSTITENDILKVLQDETHDNMLSYYKFNGTTFNYIGSEQSADVDDSTIDRNSLNQLQIKDGGITIDKINELVKALTITDSATDNKFVTEKALYDYFASGNDGDARNISNVDLNTISNTGIYFCNVCTNRPVSANGVMVVGKISDNATYVAQLYLAFAEDEAWLRFKDNNTWKEWKRLAYISDLDSKVDKTTTVNGHALSGNVSVSKSDVGLGNVANTGDSATPVSGGTTKFTTGGAYTELAKKQNTLVSGTSIKTLNSTSLLGSGNIATPTGVKGNAETNYRTGNVNITPANIGLGNVVNVPTAVSITATPGDGFTFSALNALKLAPNLYIFEIKTSANPAMTAGSYYRFTTQTSLKIDNNIVYDNSLSFGTAWLYSDVSSALTLQFSNMIWMSPVNKNIVQDRSGGIYVRGIVCTKLL